MLEDDERARLKEEIKAELRDEARGTRRWAWRGKRDFPAAGIALIIFGVYLMLPGFGVEVPSFTHMILPAILIVFGISLFVRR